MTCKRASKTIGSAAVIGVLLLERWHRLWLKALWTRGSVWDQARRPGEEKGFTRVSKEQRIGRSATVHVYVFANNESSSEELPSLDGARSQLNYPIKACTVTSGSLVVLILPWAWG